MELKLNVIAFPQYNYLTLFNIINTKKNPEFADDCIGFKDTGKNSKSRLSVNVHLVLLVDA